MMSSEKFPTKAVHGSASDLDAWPHEVAEVPTEGLLGAKFTYAQDVLGDLDTYVRLAKAGHFKKADEFFSEYLVAWKSHFAISAQHALVLIDQGAFGKAELFLQQLPPFTEGDETTVIGLLLALAQVHTRVYIETATVKAQEALRTFGDLTVVKLSSTKLQMMMLSFRILDCVLSDPVFVSAQPVQFRYPLLVDESEGLESEHARFMYAISELLEGQYLWEANTLLAIYLRHGETSLTSLDMTNLLEKVSDEDDSMFMSARLAILGTCCEALNIRRWREQTAPADFPKDGIDTTDSPATDPLVELFNALNDDEGVANRVTTHLGFPTKDSRAYQTLLLAALGREMLNSMSNWSDDIDSDTYRQPSKIADGLRDVMNFADENEDYQLKFAVYWRQALIWRDPTAKDFIGVLRPLWEETKASLECKKFLKCLSLITTSPANDLSKLSVDISAHCKSLPQLNPRPNQALPRTSEVYLENWRSLDSSDIQFVSSRSHYSLQNICAWLAVRKISVQALFGQSKAPRSLLELFAGLQLKPNYVDTSKLPGKYPREDDHGSGELPSGIPRYLEVKAKRILFLGHTGVGKSSTINAITASNLKTAVGKPCTSEIAIRESTVDGHLVQCIDTPGLGDDRLSDFDIVKMIEEHLADEYPKTKIDLVFYLINIAFLRIDLATILDLRVSSGMLGDGVPYQKNWNNVCFLFTHGIHPNATGFGIDTMKTAQTEMLELWKRDNLAQYIKMGASIKHLIFDAGDGYDEYCNEAKKIVQHMSDRPGQIEMQCQIEMCNQGKPASQTTAVTEWYKAGVDRDELWRQSMEKNAKEKIKAETRVRKLEEELRRAEGVIENSRSHRRQRSQQLIGSSDSTLNEERRRFEEELNRSKKSDSASHEKEEEEKENELVMEQQEKIDAERERVRKLDEKQEKLQKQRDKFQRDREAIEATGGRLPQYIVFNRSKVTVHLRVAWGPFHLVYSWANNVKPGEFAMMRCPGPGWYTLDVCLATGTASEFTSWGQYSATAAKVGLGVAMFFGAGIMASTAAAEAAFTSGVAEAAGWTGAGIGTYAHRAARWLASDFAAKFREPVVDIELQANHPLSPDATALMQSMKAILDGNKSQTLVNQWPFGLWGRTRVEICNGPELYKSTNGSVCYVFDKNTKPFVIRKLEEFKDELIKNDAGSTFDQHAKNFSFK